MALTNKPDMGNRTDSFWGNFSGIAEIFIFGNAILLILAQEICHQYYINHTPLSLKPVTFFYCLGYAFLHLLYDANCFWTFLMSPTNQRQQKANKDTKKQPRWHAVGNMGTHYVGVLGIWKQLVLCHFLQGFVILLNIILSWKSIVNCYW